MKCVLVPLLMVSEVPLYPPYPMQDLCDRLWDICDVRRDEWEVERNRIMTESWVEDHLGLLLNTYISLMQVSCVTLSQWFMYRVFAVSLCSG